MLHFGHFSNETTEKALAYYQVCKFHKIATMTTLATLYKQLGKIS